MAEKKYRVVTEGNHWWVEAWQENCWRSRIAWFDFESDALEYIEELKSDKNNISK